MSRVKQREHEDSGHRVREEREEEREEEGHLVPSNGKMLASLF